MSPQSEFALENSLISQLAGMEYSFVTIEDESQMLANLKKQLEVHNKITFTNGEFERVLNHLNSGGVFERAKILRDRYGLRRDNDELVYISFLNCDDWCLNELSLIHI